MAVVTVQEVKDAINFPTTGGPVSDDAYERFIEDSTEEVYKRWHTQFGYVEDSGTANGDFSTTTFSDSGKTWTVDYYQLMVVWIYEGTGAGQYREITENSAIKITVSPAFDTTPDATSKYRITRLGYKDETVDGNGKDTMFLDHQPLINLNAVTIDSNPITPAYIYQYNDSTKLILSDEAEEQIFKNNKFQQINFKYIYGVYPIPRQIKRIITLLAALRVVASKVSGSYTDFATVALPGGFSGSKGQPYINLKAGVEEIRLEVKELERGYRPFALFG